MKPELVAEQRLTVPAGRIWLTLARHDDGHYSGVATLLPSGRRIGWLESDRPGASGSPLTALSVDTTVAGAEVGDALAGLWRMTALAEAAQLGGPAVAADQVLAPWRQGDDWSGVTDLHPVPLLDLLSSPADQPTV